MAGGKAWDPNARARMRRRYYGDSGVIMSKYGKKWRQELKLEALAAYSDGDVIRCACPGCGQDDYRFLTIDHVNGDGTAHRKSLGLECNGGVRSVRGGWEFYSKLKSLGWPNDPPLRVLCYDCNCVSYHNGGVCPHLYREKLVARKCGDKVVVEKISNDTE